jgi:hypothetical protein
LDSEHVLVALLHVSFHYAAGAEKQNVLNWMTGTLVPELATSISFNFGAFKI